MATAASDARRPAASDIRRPAAFDAHRPPDEDDVRTCIHCGFSLPTCPTYVLWGEEMDSPRGRIVLMRQGLEPGSDMDAMAVHFDRCLGCMACVTACPSGVRYDRLIEATRPQVERNHRRSFRERAFRRACFELFTHPGRLRVLVPLAAVAGRLGPERLRWLDRFPRLAAATRLAPDVALSAAWRRLPAHTPARGTRRGRVGLLQGCVARVIFPAVNEATVRVLAAEGFDVAAPATPGCCGALQLHSGAEPEALNRAKETITTFEACEAVITNAAGCGSAMKDYARLLADDPAWAERAAAFSAKVRDITEFLAAVEPRAPRHPIRFGDTPTAGPVRVAYHDACHLAHAQGVRAQPRALLAAIPGLEVAEPAGWEVCCGSAGLYNLLQPEAAEELGRRKAANLAATGARAVVAGNPGCTLQITAHLGLPVYHPVELLDASIQGGTLR
ncbi:MAG: heterodisulfide reductase-related iron-sulfur binding cluster [Actinomycetota bacterium]|nr:heterodisulfide reductase-related iron-sulfur binding cluster [Actinomycetota bacterium]